MAGSNAAVVVFTIGAFVLWVYALAWALRHRKHPWYHTWLLVLLTLFWFIGESLAIRLGKYEYPPFPEALRLNLPFIGGTPQQPGVLERALWKLVPTDEGPPWKFDRSCKATSYGIPLPVVAIEAALMFGFFRLATRLLKVNNGRLRTSIATGGLCALLMVNLFAVLDPVVSTHMWCQPGAVDPAAGFQHLPFPLWNWFTTTTHPSYWFGVPVINYAAWFVAAAVFGTLARYDDQRSDLLIRKYKIWLRYAAATVVILGLYTLVAMGVLLVVNNVLTHGQDWIFPGHALFSQRTWQLGVVALLLGFALALCWFGCRSHGTPEVVAAGPLVFGLLYSLWLLSRSFHIWMFVVWLVTVAVAAIVIRWHFVGQRVFGDEEPLVQPAEGQARSDGRLVR